MNVRRLRSAVEGTPERAPGGSESAAEGYGHRAGPGILAVVTSPWLLASVVALVIFGIWEWSVQAFRIPNILLPGPGQVLNVFWADLLGGTYWRHGASTAYELGVGFIAGTVLGVIVAAIMVHVPIMERAVYPYVIVLQTFPKIAIAPLLITWFGFGIAPKAILAGLLAFFPVLVNMIVGLRSVDEEQLELLRSLSAGRLKIFRVVRLPASLPFFFASIETGIVLAMLGAITGEFVGARTGLGYLVVQKNAVMAIDGVFAVLVVLGILGVGLHLAIREIHRKVVFWKQ